MSNLWLWYALAALIAALVLMALCRSEGQPPAKLEGDDWLLIIVVSIGWLPLIAAFVMVFGYKYAEHKLPSIELWDILTKEFGDE